MKERPAVFRFRSRNPGAFSLVEMALALGVVGFVLVGIVGALPVAMNNERISVAQTRASSVANTVFARFRAQPFGTVLYADDNPTGLLDLNTWNTIPASNPIQDNPVVLADAVFDEAINASATDSRRLHIYSDPRNVPVGTPSFKIVFRFNNSPPGMLSPYTDASGKKRAQGNVIELSVYQDARPLDTNYVPTATDVYHFTTVIANRAL